MPNLIGTTINRRYKVIESLGRGGMADVYRVWDVRRQEHLAAKVLREDLAYDVVFLKRFEREARTLSRLQHPNIVRFYGLEKGDDLVLMLMDYIEGVSLRKMIYQARGKGMKEKTTLRIIQTVINALHYAHQSGIVHCDLKPGNILIDKNGKVFVSDFGIARHMDAATMTLVGVGTPAYMAPELISGHEPSPRSDIYSLGIMLYEMLTGGERPFTGERASITGTTAQKVRWEQVNLQPDPPKKYNRKVSSSLQAIVMRCLEKDPRKRFISCRDMLVAIRQPDAEILAKKRAAEEAAKKRKEEKRKRIEEAGRQRAEEGKRRKKEEAKQRAEEKKRREEEEAKRRATEKKRREEKEARLREEKERIRKEAQEKREAEKIALEKIRDERRKQAEQDQAARTLAAKKLKEEKAKQRAEERKRKEAEAARLREEKEKLRKKAQSKREAENAAKEKLREEKRKEEKAKQIADEKKRKEVESARLRDEKDQLRKEAQVEREAEEVARQKLKEDKFKAEKASKEPEKKKVPVLEKKSIFKKINIPDFISSHQKVLFRIGGAIIVIGLAAGAYFLYISPRGGFAKKEIEHPDQPGSEPTLDAYSEMISKQDGMVLVYVPEGKFLRGSETTDTDASQNEIPQQNIFLDAFWIDKTEVTNSMYALFLNENGNNENGGKVWFDSKSKYAHIYKANGEWKVDEEFKDHPIIEVTWNGANQYCSWVGRRLPSEAEWEKAARGENGLIFPWGNFFDSSYANLDDETIEDGFALKCNSNGCDRYEKTAPVASFKNGVSPYGAYDMVGNVWEWVQDYYFFLQLQEDNPINNHISTNKVIRGGSWDSNIRNARTANRNATTLDYPHKDIGFRCAISDPDIQQAPHSPEIDETKTQLDTGSDVYLDKDGMALVFVPEGEFVMGSDLNERDEIATTVLYLDAYWMDQTEVTNEMFKEFLNTNGNQREGEFERKWYDTFDKGTRIFQDGNSWLVEKGYENHPVSEVNWYAANAYCLWVGRRLPTEQEWEKAARYIDGRIYPWGNEINCSFGNFNGCSEFETTTPVGHYSSGVSPYGIFDLAGNVSEWVNNWYIDESDMIIKGGAYGSNFQNVLSNTRKIRPIYEKYYYLGFRCAISAIDIPEGYYALTPNPTFTPTYLPNPTETNMPTPTPLDLSIATDGIASDWKFVNPIYSDRVGDSKIDGTFDLINLYFYENEYFIYLMIETEDKLTGEEITFEINFDLNGNNYCGQRAEIHTNFNRTHGVYFWAWDERCNVPNQDTLISSEGTKVVYKDVVEIRIPKELFREYERFKLSTVNLWSNYENQWTPVDFLLD